MLDVCVGAEELNAHTKTTIALLRKALDRRPTQGSTNTRQKNTLTLNVKPIGLPDNSKENLLESFSLLKTNANDFLIGRNSQSKLQLYFLKEATKV